MTETCLPIVNWLKNWFTPKDGDYTYSISSSEYNPTIDSTITIYVKVTDGNNTGVANHTFTMKTKNGDVSLTTDSNGEATHSYTCDTWGNQRFQVNGYSMYLNVTGWKTAVSDSSYLVQYNEDYVSVKLNYTGSALFDTTVRYFGAEVLKHEGNDLRPPMPVITGDGSKNFYIADNTHYGIGRYRLSGSVNGSAYAHFLYKRK